MRLDEYLRELKTISLLTPDVEAELWTGYKVQGNLDSRRQIIESYQPLVFKVAMKWHLPEPLMLDAIQEGTVGLIEAVEGFDPSRGVAFSLYATHRIRGRILNFLSKEGDQLWDKSTLDDGGDIAKILVDDRAEVSGQVERDFLVEQVMAALRRLPPKEQLILNGVFVEEYEPKQLAAELDVSLSHIYRLQKKGIRRLRGMLSKLMGNW